MGDAAGDDRPYLRTVGLRIRLLRVARGLSQEELGEASGVSRVTIGSIERAEHAASVLAYRRLARALEVELSDLLDEDDEQPLARGRRSSAD